MKIIPQHFSHTCQGIDEETGGLQQQGKWRNRLKQATKPYVSMATHPSPARQPGLRQ